ncbi:Uncharacterised protein family (UPF0180) [Caminicella sporogenes DSM 14501]|uniref:Uncharacterized protein family (UPF0180) n=1 Tax=Caminicella sporogenes DSM 14501 TaxID=1121266 RepID=A0A1M6MFW5_9FIRM|nr:YkuS family protein [Caminicella sporogenes]WIF94850.1 YkuS family protein [Caminicella sporogenes]SHJ82351.1 Uncharacterised protein family (UPF0180) [Caminicella sporogenes DSM 14501]
MKRIAVENSLTNVKSYLETQGYTVESLESNKDNLKSFDAIVVSGQNSNFLGMHNTETKGSIISAKGLTPEDVHKEIQNRIE